MIRLLLPLVSGILLHPLLPSFPYPLVIAILSTTLLFSILFQTLPIQLRFRWEMIRGIAWTIGWIGMGWLLHHHHSDTQRADWYGHKLNYVKQLRVEVKQVSPTRSGKSMRLVLAVLEANFGNYQQPCSGEILGWWPLSHPDSFPAIGSTLWIQNKLQSIASSGNPGGFNWKDYAARQQWYHQMYLSPETYILQSTNRAPTIAGYTHAAQTALRHLLHKYLAPQTVGLGEALLLGYRHDVDASTLQAYSDTGVIHLIAVSGMHLGLVYLVLLYLFSWIPAKHRKPTIESVLVVVGIWLFALLTGAGASVLRAAVMLSFLQLGRMLKRPAHAFNQLWLSAWILLVWNPTLLWDVGFQLSYAAVAGILWVYPWMRRPMLDWPTYGRYLGELVAVSISAQVFTTPLSLMHFHQFPNYFLIANLLTVSLASVILIALIILTAAATIPFVAEAWGKLVSVGLALLQQIVGWISQWPGAVAKPIAADGLFALLLSCCLGCTILMLQEKRWKWIYVCSLLGLCTYWYQLTLQKQQTLQSTLLVYDTKRSTCIDVIQGEYAWTWHSDSASIPSNQGITEAAHTEFLVRKSRSMILPAGFQQIQVGKTRMARVDVTLSLSQWEAIEPPDILFVGGKANQLFIQLASRFQQTRIILEPTVPIWKQKQWTEAAQQVTLRCWPVSLRGALMLPLPL